MTTCRFNGKHQPRTITGRHQDDCGSDLCAGCQPCFEDHCRIDGHTHVAGTCAECMGEVRERLHNIARMTGSLSAEVEHRGINGEAMTLLGPACNPEARGHLEASVLAGRMPLEAIDISHTKECENPACIGCVADVHPMSVLEKWDAAWRDALDHAEPVENVAMPALVDYIDQTMTYMGGYPHVPFEDFAKDLRRCESHLEAVLHDGEQVDTGAPCMACQIPLRKVYEGAELPWSSKEHPTHAKEDGYACAKCRRWHNENQYMLSVTHLHREEAAWLTDQEMAIRTGLAAVTIRQWSRPPRSVDGPEPIEKKRENGRVVYSVADVEGRMDAKKTA